MSLSSRGSVRPLVDPSSLFTPDVADLVALAAGSDDGVDPLRPALLLVLVVGRAGLEEALAEASRNAGLHATPVEIERCEKTDAALSTARVYAPDVILLDGDAIGGEGLIKKLSDEPLTARIPVIVITPTSTDELIRWKAAGAKRIISRWAPAEAMYAACVEEGASLARSTARPIGEVTVEELRECLSEALQMGLTDAVQTGERGVKIPLGEGREITSALWLALARIREEVTSRSKGAVRFVSNAPDAVYPIAFASGTRGSQRGGSLAPPLTTTRVVIADDDPAVRWFLGKILEEAGATVIEAADGEQALGTIIRTSPHAVLCDVLMPKLDGFGLCRMMKRDPMLRDVPFVLLSWREDLLQRVHELGAEADGYLRKEASVPAILQRLGELLRPRHRLEDRLRVGGEVQGRLDGFTVWTLFTMLRDHRPDASLEIRDAACVFEIEMREGVLRRVHRIAPDGAIERSEKALGSLLGARSGRFVVRNAQAAIRAELPGTTLEQQVRPWIARARAVQQVTRGDLIPRLKSITIDVERMESYLAATPGSTRSVIRRLASGTSPKALLVDHGVEPRLFDDIVADLTSHNAILAVLDKRGRDLLPAAIARASEVLEHGAAPSCFAPTGQTPEPALVLTPSVVALPYSELVHTPSPAVGVPVKDEVSSGTAHESEPALGAPVNPAANDGMSPAMPPVASVSMSPTATRTPTDDGWVLATEMSAGPALDTASLGLGTAPKDQETHGESDVLEEQSARIAVLSAVPQSREESTVHDAGRASGDEPARDEPRHDEDRSGEPEPSTVNELIIDRDPWDMPESFPSFPLGNEIEIEASASLIAASPSISVDEPPAEEQTALELPRPRPSAPPFSSVLTPTCGCGAHDHAGPHNASRFEHTVPLALDAPVAGGAAPPSMPDILVTSSTAEKPSSSPPAKAPSSPPARTPFSPLGKAPSMLSALSSLEASILASVDLQATTVGHRGGSSALSRHQAHGVTVMSPEGLDVAALESSLPLVTPSPSVVAPRTSASAPASSLDDPFPSNLAADMARFRANAPKPAATSAIVSPTRSTAVSSAMSASDSPPGSVSDAKSTSVSPTRSATVSAASSLAKESSPVAPSARTANELDARFAPISATANRDEVTVVTRPRVTKKKPVRAAGWLATAGVLAVTGLGIATYGNSFGSAAPAAAALADSESDETSAEKVEVRPSGLEKNRVANETSPASTVSTGASNGSTSASNGSTGTSNGATGSSGPTVLPPGVTIEDLPLPEGAHITEGLGLVEIVASKRDRFEMDHVDIGHGAHVSSPLPAGTHELRAHRRADELPMTVAVKSGRLTRVDLRKPWRH